MLSNDFDPGLKSCALVKNKDGSWSGLVIVSSARSGALKTNVLQKIERNDLDSVSSFLIKNGVMDTEIDNAVKTMMANDHNYANFGFFGSFLFSEFKGPVH